MIPVQQYIIVAPILGVTCELCTTSDAAACIRTSWPIDDEVSGFHDVFICSSCAHLLAERLQRLTPPEDKS